MIFHRFLSTPRKLNIFINGEQDLHAVKPWDPFCKAHKATDPKPEASIPYDGKSVKVKGFILPHKDMLTADEFDIAAGPTGWNGQQGFYIYRNDRLLVAGSWLGLRDGSQRWKTEEHIWSAPVCKSLFVLAGVRLQSYIRPSVRGLSCPPALMECAPGCPDHYVGFRPWAWPMLISGFIPAGVAFSAITARALRNLGDGSSCLITMT